MNSGGGVVPGIYPGALEGVALIAYLLGALYGYFEVEP